MKKILSILLLLMSFTTSVSAYDFMVDGLCYNINEDGESVEVTYDHYSRLYDLISDRNFRYDPDSHSYNELTGVIVIPKSVKYNGMSYPVTAIGTSAFHGCIGLTSVELPESVTKIGMYAFERCADLTSVEFSESVTEIGYGAFEDCTGLTSVSIPNSVIKIDISAFKGCTGLTSLVIPNSVTEIDESAFVDCTGLASIKVDKGNTKYDSREDCNAIIETTSNLLIVGCKNTSIPNTVTEIGSSAFKGCTGLTSIKIPSSVTKIGESVIYVYGGAELTKLLLELSYGGAFERCTGLTYVEIPESVTSIGQSAFSGCTGLTSVTIGNSVTKIGSSAFMDCTGLTSVKIPESVTEIGYGAFSGCSGLTSVEIPESVTEIGSSIFSGCTGLTFVEIPESVTSIGQTAFSGCTGLTSVEIPESVTEIGYGAFSDCSGLTSVEIPESVTEIGSSIFSGCKGLTSVEIPESVTKIGSSAFSGCKGLTSVEIPESVTEIGYGAFSGCSGLVSVEIPESVTKIGSSAFSGCKGLTSVKIPNLVTKIGSSAFRGCTGLASVEIPESVTEIGNEAFSGCTSLSHVLIPNSVVKIGGSAFSDCTGLDSVFSYIYEPQRVVYGTNNLSEVSVFKNANRNSCRIIVPASTMSLYEQTSAWYYFPNKEENGNSDISNKQTMIEGEQDIETHNDDFFKGLNTLIKYVSPELLNNIGTHINDFDKYYNEKKYDELKDSLSHDLNLLTSYYNNNIIEIRRSSSDLCNFIFYISDMHEKIGRCFYAKNQLDSALYHYRQAMMFPPTATFFYPIYAQLNEDYGMYYISKGDCVKAYQYFEKALSTKKESTYSYFLKNTSNKRAEYWQNQAYLFLDLFPAVTFEVYKQKEDSILNSGMIGVLYNNSALFSKGLLLTSETELSRVIHESGNSKLIDRYNELPRLYESEDEKDKAKAEKYEAEILEISKEYGDFMDNLQLTWDSVQAALSAGDIAIEFLSFPNLRNDGTMYVALTLRPGYTHPHMTVLCEENELLAAARQPYTCTALSDSIWGKLYRAGELNDVKNIFFSPCGELHKIGIESMPHWDGSGRLMSECGLNFYRLSSTRELAMNRTPIESSGAALFGGIYYDAEKTDHEKLGARYKGHEGMYATRGFDFGDVDLRGINAGYLGSSLDEVKSIKALFEKRKDSVYYKIKDDATEASFKAIEGQKKRIIHIATHGFFLTDSAARAEKANHKNGRAWITDDAMTHSGLLFAAAAITIKYHQEVSESWEDGVLTAYEVSQLNLRGLDLVVLSACQTGNGEISGEGVFGMQRGFKMAGAQSIIMSLWDVNDKATKDMMTQFYKYYLVDSLSKREAFLKAQEDVRNNDNNYTYDVEDPVNDARLRAIRPHWAAFILLDAI